MKKLLIVLASLVILSAFTTPDTWHNDKPHSQLTFTITHLGISDVSGNFNDFNVTITNASKDFSDAIFEMSADVASIDTRVEARNNHLKSPDFFDVARYPKLTYKSTSIKKKGKNRFVLTGDLTMHGITKAVTMDLLYRGVIENPMSKKPTHGFQLTGKLKRSDFNIGASFPEPMLSDEVRIKADGEFIQ